MLTATSYHNGNKIHWNDSTKKWYYTDGKNIDKYRKCPKCSELPTKKGHDACLANLPDVKNACCGHGVEDGYIQFKDGTYIRFKLKKIERK